MISFKIIDDFLIDSMFQPISDWVSTNIGWSSDQLAAIFIAIKLVAFPVIIHWLYMGNPFDVHKSIKIIFAFIGILLWWAFFYRIQRLIQGTLPGKSAMGLNQRRITDYNQRKKTCIFIPFLLPILTLVSLSHIEELRLPMLSLLICVVSSFCALYFEACTDLPKPLKRRALALNY